MRSLVLATAIRFVAPLLLLFSILLLLRGHNLPGGGFAGGLVAATSFALIALAISLDEARRALIADPLTLIAGGLLIALVSALFAVMYGMEFMKGIWTDLVLPFGWKLHLGTPLLFDIGVYLVVMGVTLLVVFTMMEE